MVVYMEVTKDELELPVAVADTIAELARMTGTRANNISSSMSHARKNGWQCPYIEVEID